MKAYSPLFLLAALGVLSAAGTAAAQRTPREVACLPKAAPLQCRRVYVSTIADVGNYTANQRAHRLGDAPTAARAATNDVRHGPSRQPH
jgi:hypothetical protein